ncbi:MULTISPECIES: hypothetical protein [Streptomyces]|uniref:hypothetical protein n=1 Tax=Streptomyces TaxID=1883 RepID=UPI001F0ED555|nr:MULTISPECIES: hypothetical protein [Streptomyces]
MPMPRGPRWAGDPYPGGALPDPGRADPAVLAVLLARHGWRRRGGAPGRYGRWTPPGPRGARTSLLVPESRAFPDSADLLGEALDALARTEEPAAREILLALAVPGDEIRWRRDVPDGHRAGPLAARWTAEEELRSAARHTLLAAALAGRARTGYHGARHRRAAAAALGDVLLLGAASGGRTLTAFAPVAPARPLTVRLHRALHAAREAVDHRRATGGMDAFDAAVAAGVSRELTEALITLVKGTEGAGVTISWAPAAGIPEGCGPDAEPVEFSPGDLPALREAGARYRRAEPSVAVRLTGTVDRLRRTGGDGAGTVRLRVLAGAEVPHVRVTLDEEAYRIAGQAHLVGLPVRVDGRLDSRAGFRRLTGARGVAPVTVDEAERDRLMKSLQENLDFFEEACGGDCEG